MNDLIIKDNIKIEDLIYEVRGKQVMLDSDLAKLFGYETKQLNRQVQRNYDRFPENYCFKLTEEEYNSLRCQIGTLKNGRGVHKKYLPYVFTEHGVTMLAGILKSEEAVKVSLLIVDTFIAMRKYISANLIEQKYFNELTIKNTEDIKKLKESFDKLSTKEEINHIFYEGQIYDAYDLFMKILSKSKKEVIIIDNYTGRELFNIIKDIKVKVKIYTKNIDNMAKTKYEKQYSNIEVINTDIFHDRFILIDNKTLYHSGASFKDIGKKCFSINKIEDTNVIKDLITRLEVIK